MIREYSQPKTSTNLHDEAFMEYNTFMGVRQISQILTHSQVTVSIFACTFQTLGVYGGKLCTGVLTVKCDNNGVIVLSNSYIMKTYNIFPLDTEVHGNPNLMLGYLRPIISKPETTK
jgi:hypothetical protein